MTLRISKAAIETLAVQIAEPDFEKANIERLIGHLSESEQDAVLGRAEAIAWGGIECDLSHAHGQEALLRLARVAGCPPGTAMIPWLIEHGHLKKNPSGRGFSFKNIREEDDE